MVRSVTVFDEDWTEDDMTAALEWQTEDRLKCSGCGLPLDETTAPGADDNYEAEMVACHACATADRVERNFRSADSEMAGVRRRVWES